jgi:hypothetical protein
MYFIVDGYYHCQSGYALMCGGRGRPRGQNTLQRYCFFLYFSSFAKQLTPSIDYFFDVCNPGPPSVGPCVGTVRSQADSGMSKVVSTSFNVSPCKISAFEGFIVAGNH